MRKGFFRIVLFVLTTALTALPATAAETAKKQKSGTEIDLEEYAAEVLRLTNIERKKAGIAELATDDEALQKTADTRVLEITSSCSHKRPNGKRWHTLYNENEVSFRAAGENIAYGQITPEEVVSAWMDSAGHKKNILNAAYTRVGIGVTADSDGKLYWVQNFAG